MGYSLECLLLEGRRRRWHVRRPWCWICSQIPRLRLMLRWHEVLMTGEFLLERFRNTLIRRPRRSLQILWRLLLRLSGRMRSRRQLLLLTLKLLQGDLILQFQRILLLLVYFFLLHCALLILVAEEWVLLDIVSMQATLGSTGA